MSLLQRKLPEFQPAVQPQSVPFGEGAGQEAPPAAAPVTERSIYCTHGIHEGHFPIVGLTVAEARRTLGHLLNLDREAVAVSDGQILPEEHVIREDATMLSFVKKSSVKGSSREYSTCPAN